MILTVSGAAYAAEQTGQETVVQNIVYQTADGVLSIEVPSPQWQVITDPNHWFVVSDGGNTIAIDHLSNGESLPSPSVAGQDAAAVYHAYVSTKNEVFIIKGSAVRQEDLETIMKTVGTIKVLKYDTKTAITQTAAPAASSFSVKPINETYYCTSDYLNVRTGCSTNDASIGNLSYGEAVTVLGSVTQDGSEIGWYQISFNGASAYVSAQYLSKTKPEAQQTENDYFEVYAEDGSSVRIHPVGGAMYEDEAGRTYSNTGNGVYYCITTDTTYASSPSIWAYGILSPDHPEYDYDTDVNVEGDNYDEWIANGGDSGQENVEYDENVEVNIES